MDDLGYVEIAQFVPGPPGYCCVNWRNEPYREAQSPVGFQEIGTLEFGSAGRVWTWIKEAVDAAIEQFEREPFLLYSQRF